MGMKRKEGVLKRALAALLSGALLLSSPGTGTVLAQIAPIAGGGGTGVPVIPGVIPGANPLARLGLPSSTDVSGNLLSQGSLTSAISGARMVLKKLDNGWVAESGRPPDAIVKAQDAAVTLNYRLEKVRRLPQARGDLTAEHVRALESVRDAVQRLELAAAAPEVQAVLERDLLAPRIVRQVEKPLQDLKSLETTGSSLELQKLAAGRVFARERAAETLPAVVPTWNGPAAVPVIAPEPAVQRTVTVQSLSQPPPPAAKVPVEEDGAALTIRSPSLFKTIAAAVALAPIPIVGNVAIHELGHYLAARAAGLKVNEVQLFRHKGGGRLHGHVDRDGGTLKQGLAVSLAGPAASIAHLAVSAAFWGWAFAFGLDQASPGMAMPVAAGLATLGVSSTILNLTTASTAFKRFKDSDIARASDYWRQIRAGYDSEEGIRPVPSALSTSLKRKRIALVAAGIFTALFLVPVVAYGSVQATVIAGILLTAPLLPIVYETLVWSRAEDKGKASWKESLGNAFQAAILSLPVMLLTSFARALIGDTVVFPAAVAALWVLSAIGSQQLAAGSRAEVVGGWQASHDQKYRVDTNTGLLRDVRGHKYGEDRYEEYSPGYVRRGERFVFTTFNAWIGTMWLSGGGLWDLLLYNALFTGAFALRDWIGSRRAPYRAPSDPDSQAHARKFKQLSALPLPVPALAAA